MDPKKSQSIFSILMFPWLAHGHIFPYLELAKNLSKKNFKIYFCSTAINLTSIKNSLENTSNIHLVELHLPNFPDLPPQYHTRKNVPPHLFPRLFQAFQMSKSSFSEIIKTLMPDLLIHDVIQPWAAKIASSNGIPAVPFSTTGATAYSLYYHQRFLRKGSPFPYKAIYTKDFEKKALRAVTALPDKLYKKDEHLGFDPFRLSSHRLVLMKSCRAIEGKYIDYLSLLIKKKVVPVGTLVITQDNDHTDEDHSITDWLGKKKKFSTVFISFGSQNYLSKDQIEEIAKGLEICEVNFIWALRFPSGEKKISLEEALPMGFLEKVKERGLILEGWAPQAKILGHPSIGAFVSHCGMSSTFESIYFSVPVVGIPLKNDQPMNARLLVEGGIGVEVARDENGNLRRDEIARAINLAVSEKFGEEMRLRVAELSKKMRSEEEEAMNEAAAELRQLCVESKWQNLVSRL